MAAAAVVMMRVEDEEAALAFVFPWVRAFQEATSVQVRHLGFQCVSIGTGEGSRGEFLRFSVLVEHHAFGKLLRRCILCVARLVGHGF